MNRVRYTTLSIPAPRYWVGLGALIVLFALGLLAGHRMESHGHWITGMSNQIVWGVPHVFAILLIVAASGSLNVASLGTVFGIAAYKPLARLSGLLAIALLCGGLLVLVLDLGRPDRLIVAMTSYNFRSVFAWNIFLYTGFVLLTAVYLQRLFLQGRSEGARRVGMAALIWRIVLTSGTGCIFGFLVARSAYDAAIMAPLFVALSLSVGSASFLLVSLALYRVLGRPMQLSWATKLRKLNGVFIGVLLYLVAVQYLAHAYVAENVEVVRFVLFEGGVISVVFWLGQILLGSIVPMVIFLGSRFSAVGWTCAGASLVVLGAMAHLYVLIIGGQAMPLDIFPGLHETSSFFDGAIAHYRASAVEWMLGVGGVALSLIVVFVGVRVLPFIPEAPGETVGN